MNDSILESLRQAVPALRLKTDATELEHYGRDWTRRWPPSPLAVVLPHTVQQVQAIVRWANAQRVALVPSGGRTGLSGGAVAANGELVVSLERMSRVLGFDAVDRTLTVQPGIALQSVQDAARERDLFYPVDFGVGPRRRADPQRAGHGPCPDQRAAARECPCHADDPSERTDGVGGHP